jgi:hypothetical protein
MKRITKPEAAIGTPDFSFPDELKTKARVFAEETGLVPRGEAPPPAPAVGEIAPDKIEAINSLYKKFIFTMKKGAALAFEIGKMLREIWDQMDAYDSWPAWCREHLSFSMGTANRCLRIYENFKDDLGALAGLTASGALKLLSAPRREALQAEGDENPDRQPDLPWERYFELPPLTRDVKLVNHRFEVPNSHEVYLIRRGLNYPVKIAEVLAPEDRRLNTAHRGMLEGVQAALERYYQELERIEALEVKK